VCQTVVHTRPERLEGGRLSVAIPCFRDAPTPVERGVKMRAAMPCSAMRCPLPAPLGGTIKQHGELHACATGRVVLWAARPVVAAFSPPGGGAGRHGWRMHQRRVHRCMADDGSGYSLSVLFDGHPEGRGDGQTEGAQPQGGHVGQRQRQQQRQQQTPLSPQQQQRQSQQQQQQQQQSQRSVYGFAPRCGGRCRAGGSGTAVHWGGYSSGRYSEHPRCVWG
jgi:hypothetical protein